MTNGPKIPPREPGGTVPSRERFVEQFADGFSDDLEPVRSVDLSRVKTASDLLEHYAGASFGARQLGEAAEIFVEMVKDPECVVICTISGAMTVAKMGLVIADMIDHGLVDAIISTGALMAHGFVENAGKTHFKYRQGMSDRELYYKGYDRVYDTLELEKNLDDVELIFNDVLGNVDDGATLCSRDVTRLIGEHLAAQAPDARGVLMSASRKKVPIFIPAFTDSELGLDFAIHNKRREAKNRAPLRFDPFIDLDAYADICLKAKRLGIFTIGGGVPRNWAQQVGPYVDILAKRLHGGEHLIRFRYGIRICPEPVHWGGLSGCTYSEGVSWGKFVPPADGGRFAEVPADATIAWPLLVKAVLERLGKA